MNHGLGCVEEEKLIACGGLDSMGFGSRQSICTCLLGLCKEILESGKWVVMVYCTVCTLEGFWCNFSRPIMWRRHRLMGCWPVVKAVNSGMCGGQSSGEGTIRNPKLLHVSAVTHSMCMNVLSEYLWLFLLKSNWNEMTNHLYYIKKKQYIHISVTLAIVFP